MSVTLSSLFIVCSHGRRSAHGIDDGSWCQGGRPVTLGDLDGAVKELRAKGETMNEARHLGDPDVWWEFINRSYAELVEASNQLQNQLNLFGTNLALYVHAHSEAVESSK